MTGVRAVVVAGAGVLGLLAIVRCADVTRGLGEACIRNEDCFSGVCAGQVCIAPPTVFDAAPSTTNDAGSDALPDGSPADVTTAPDTSTPPPVDAGHEAAPGDAVAPHDATGDGKRDAPDASGTTDAHVIDAAAPHDTGTDAGHDAGLHDDAARDGASDGHTSG